LFMCSPLRVGTVLSAAVAALALGAAAAGNSSPRKVAAARYKVPPGFVVEQVAGPPLVRYPLFAAFDDRGRLFVAEGTGTNLPGEELAKRKLGRILLLEDTDGDGRFDTSNASPPPPAFPPPALCPDPP